MPWKSQNSIVKSPLTIVFYIAIFLAFLSNFTHAAKAYRRSSLGNVPTIITAPGQPIPDDPRSKTYEKVDLYPSEHTDNWAVIVSTSKYWFNYRHSTNALTIYNILKERGFTDDKIILMIPEDIGCNPRNRYPGFAFNNNQHLPNLVSNDVEIDFRGDEVTFEALIEVLSGKQSPETPSHKKIFPGPNSNVFLYIAGHGGDQFMKFQDQRIMTATDLSVAVHDMYNLQRFKELFILIDTCQAATFVQDITTPGVIWGSSSALDENSYSYGFDSNVGVSLLDRLTYQVIQFFERYNEPDSSLNDFIYTFRPDDLTSNPVFGLTSYGRDVKRVPLTDFFVNIGHTKSTKHPQMIQSVYPISSTGLHRQSKLTPPLSTRTGFSVQYVPRTNIKDTIFLQGILNHFIDDVAGTIVYFLSQLIQFPLFWLTTIVLFISMIFIDLTDFSSLSKKTKI